jgi:flagellar biosynthetic protein FliR
VIQVPNLEVILTTEMARYGWPFLRVAGLLMVAPVFGARMVSPRIRLALAIGITVVLVPSLPAVPSVAVISLAGFFTAMQEVVIGLSMGFVVQMIFDALVIGGQTVAMSMGLGFAMLIDPQRGVSVPVLSQFLIVLGLLIFLALNGHLEMLRVLAASFELLPVGTGVSREGLWALLAWGSGMFAGALTIALPAVVALLVVNIAFGVMSRAAPTLNLFAVGFPVSMLLGFLVLWLNTPNLTPGIRQLMDASFVVIRRFLAS